MLAFGAGAVTGVALFDLLPEAMEIGGRYFDGLSVTSAVGLGFVVYLLLDRIVLAPRALAVLRPMIGPGSLTLHSLMDGLGIGLALHVSAAAAGVVAVAVLAHDFVDGANTVTLSLGAGSSGATARRWLVADAAAPLVGVVLAGSLTVSPPALALLLAVFAGFFLYIGSSELLPRSQQQEPRSLIVAATTAGLALILLVVRLAVH